MGRLREAAACQHGGDAPWVAFEDHAECRHCHWCNRGDEECFTARHAASRSVPAARRPQYGDVTATGFKYGCFDCEDGKPHAPHTPAPAAAPAHEKEG